MTPEVLIRGGSVAGASGLDAADVLIRGTEIAAIGLDLNPSPGSTIVLDAEGCWVGPGFVDVHTHLREPGAMHKEDIATGSEAAAAGGFTAVVAMPNTEPPIDNPALARWVGRRGREIGLVDVLPAGTLTVGRAGRRLPDFEAMHAAGVRMFTDDGDTVADGSLLEQAMERLAAIGGVVTQHAIDPQLSGEGHLHDGRHAARLGVAGIPPEAETVIVARDIELIRRTGAAYHLQHVSCAESVEMVATAKAEGLPITAEATPHHLAFEESALETAGTHLKMMPPIRERADRDAIREGLRSGIIDVVATDHAPHASHEKLVPFDEAAFGVTGLENAAAVVNTCVGLGPRDFFRRMSVAPALIGRIDGHGRWLEPGATANLVVFDPNAETTPTSTRSRSSNNPYLGSPWRGRVRWTILRGRPSYRDVEVSRA